MAGCLEPSVVAEVAIMVEARAAQTRALLALVLAVHPMYLVMAGALHYLMAAIPILSHRQKYGMAWATNGIAALPQVLEAFQTQREQPTRMVILVMAMPKLSLQRLQMISR